MIKLKYWIMTGLFFGYSKEAIHAYVMRSIDVYNDAVTEFTPTSTGTLLDGTALIPSARELAMTLEEVTSDVNSRRICSTPFPNDLAFAEEFDSFVENPTPEALGYLEEVLIYLRENTYESYLRTNARRRGRGDVPVGRDQQVTTGA